MIIKLRLQNFSYTVYLIRTLHLLTELFKCLLWKTLVKVNYDLDLGSSLQAGSLPFKLLFRYKDPWAVEQREAISKVFSGSRPRKEWQN